MLASATTVITPSPEPTSVSEEEPDHEPVPEREPVPEPTSAGHAPDAEATSAPAVSRTSEAPTPAAAPAPEPSPEARQASARPVSPEPVETPVAGPNPGAAPTPAAAPSVRGSAGDGRRPDAGDEQRKRLVLVVAGVLALLLAAVALPALGRDDDQAGTDDTPTTEAPSDAASEPSDETTLPEATDTTDTTAPTTTTEPSGALPEGWTPFADPQGAYTIGLPPGWSVQRTDSATRTDLVHPATGSLLRIEWVSPPNGDPVGAWQSSANSFASRNAGYEQIRIEPVSYRDYDAAMWEFRHGSGPVMHTGNLGFVTNGRGYALMLRTPEDRWAASQPLFEQFKQAFKPT
jgi:eukaryotic-like serine/threonine-protein kinase